MRKIFILLILIPVLSANPIVAQQSPENVRKKTNSKPSKVIRVDAKVLAVEDGDRIKIAADDGSVYSLTLLGVDAPDEKQNYYKKAKKRLAELIDGKNVTAIMHKTARDESIAVIYFGGQDVGLRLIQDGLAWYFTGHGREQAANEREKYSQAEAAARTTRLGLWEDKNPVAPWTFRGDKTTTDAIAEAPANRVTSPALDANPANTTPPQNRPDGRTYILGPRGGCYYLNDKGYKVYVKDKSLCDKP